jgi:hypothetical protein
VLPTLLLPSDPEPYGPIGPPS